MFPCWYLFCIICGVMKKRINIMKKFLFITLVVFFQNQTLLSQNTDVSMTVEIKQRLCIHILNSSGDFSSNGQYSSSLTTPLKLDDGSVRIMIFYCVPKNQVVRLQVIPHGDLEDGRGHIYPINKVSWTALGSGFRDGILNKNEPQTMGEWSGTSRVFGTINYHFNDPPDNKDIFTQFITYSLVTY